MKSQCVVCLKVLTAESFKKSQLKKHLNNLHPHLSSKPREYFVNLEMSVKKQRLNSNLRSTFDQRSASKASFEVAWLIARNKKPHTIGEQLVKPAALKMAEIMCGQKEAAKLNSVPLSAKVVKERISILAENVREQVISSIKESKCFAIQLDETTDVSSNSQLMVYVCYKGLHAIEEEIHRQALLVKRLEPALEAVMHDVINVVSVVKGHALNTRLFRELCRDGEAEYTDLHYHTEVRWLSRGNVLNRVWVLKTELEIFMVDQKHVLADNFTNFSWVAHLAYLADIFEYVNALNKELQGKNINIISAREKISAFGSKLLYWRQKTEQNKTATFSRLA
ncbi:protein FAM200A-like [Cryptotermes secundus]|uniref:protein FAM200A-like n=1 Tax=Cryptotermes secundus TaxID=105785 RepID=UPI000CD7C000|nr:protein FAM200A-like [Cryptotermes secundus]